jgi:predicted DsbA family dithiol-disulfide isomerase
LDYHSEKTKQDFYTEIENGKNMGVRGFPTFIFINETGKGFKISGMSEYQNYILALEKSFGKALVPEKN